MEADRKKPRPHLSYDEMARRRFLADYEMTRRRFLARGLQFGGAASLLGMSGFLAACGGNGEPAATGERAPVLDVTITEVGLTLSEDRRILDAFREDTGITAQGHTDILGSLQTFWLQNWENFDLINTNYNQIAPLVDQETVRPVPVADISAWNDEVTPLFTTPGSPGYNERSGWPLAGTYLDEEVEAGDYQTFKGVPNWYGFDAFGYLEGRAQGDLQSYGAIFDPANRGHSALLNEPITTIMKVATLLEGTGEAQFEGTLSNLTRDDLQIVFQFLREKKAEGQFRLFWSDFGQLVDLLVAEEVWVGDFWASAVAAAVEGGAPAVFVNMPSEGSNGWIHGGLVSPATDNYDACLTYLNWWLESGVPGAILGVQGYYSPRPDHVQPILDEQSTTKDDVSDWEYWYMGSHPDERPSLEERLPNIADWQAFPEEFEEYSRLWTEFVGG